MQKDYEFEDLDQGLFARLAGFLKQPIVAILAVLIVFSGMGVLFHFSYRDQSAQQVILPIIRADATPYKVEPEDVGGMEIPNRDSTLFASLRASQYQSRPVKVENILNEEDNTQEPLPRSQLFNGLNTGVERGEDQRDTQEARFEEKPVEEEIFEGLSVQVQEEETQFQADTQVDADAEPPVIVADGIDNIPRPGAKPAQSPSQNNAQNETISYVRSVLAEKTQKTDTDLSRTEPSSGAASGFYVQLASLPTKERAEKEWQSLKATYAAELPVKAYRLQEADLGARGTYYRIQAGPMSENAARQACEAIKLKKPGGCLVKGS